MFLEQKRFITEKLFFHLEETSHMDGSGFNKDREFAKKIFKKTTFRLVHLSFELYYLYKQEK